MKKLSICVVNLNGVKKLLKEKGEEIHTINVCMGMIGYILKQSRANIDNAIVNLITLGRWFHLCSSLISVKRKEPKILACPIK